MGSAFDFRVTCDNIVEEFYINGELQEHQKEDNDWSKISHYSIPGDMTVLAIKCKDLGGPEGFVGSGTDGEALTDSSGGWVCVTDTPKDGWQGREFNDSDWKIPRERASFRQGVWRRKMKDKREIVDQARNNIHHTIVSNN